MIRQGADRRARRGERTARGERGAAAIELALVVPVLAILALGIADVAFASVAQNRTQNAVAQAARVGSSSGSEREADASVVLAIKASLPGDLLANLDRVVVYRADAPAAEPPTSCTELAEGVDGGSAADACNSYSGPTVRSVSDITDGRFGGPTCAGAIDAAWCPLDRKESLADPPDWLGVWVRTRHDAAFGFLGGELTIARQSVYRIQPDFTG